MGVKLASRVKSIAWYIFMTLVAVIFSLPFIWMFLTAFKTPQQTAVYPPQWFPNPWTLRSFAEGFNRRLPPSIINSVRITALATLGTLISCSLTGFGFSLFSSRFKMPLFVVLLSTMMIPGTVTLIPTYVAYSKIGFINTILPLTLPSFLGASAFSTFLLKQFFDTIPRDLAEASIIDGCSWFKTYYNIYLPNAKPVLIVVLIFSVVGTWNDFFSPMIFLLDPKKYTLAVFLSFFKNQYGAVTDMGPLMAVSTISIVPIFILFFATQKYFIQGIATTGLK